VTRRRGFTLLELVVATTIMALAVVGLLAAIAGAERNAARLRDADRAAQLARLQMNELLLDPRLGPGAQPQGTFDPALAGGLEAGWRARVSAFEMPPSPVPGELALDRVELEVWWKPGGGERTFTLETYRRRLLRAEDFAGGRQ
jgi:general secretion pathway protein I